MRSKHVGVGHPALGSASEDLFSDETRALAQAEAEARAAIDANWLDEVQRTDVLKPGHPRRGLPPAHQDANWDEDATSYYARGVDGVASSRVANANAYGHASRAQADSAEWEEEQVTTHFGRPLAPEAPEQPAIFELSRLLEPDANVPARSRLGSDANRVQPRRVSRSTAQPPPPPPPRAATRRLPPAPRVPTDVPAYTSFAPELQAGVEAGARTSLSPGRSPWLWSVAAALPICTALAAYALWASGGQVLRAFTSAPAPKLALGELLQVPILPVPVSEPVVEPAPVGPAVAAPSVAEQQPSAADAVAQVPVEVVVAAPFDVTAPADAVTAEPVRTMLAERASGRRARAEQHATHGPGLARRITSLVEPADTDRDDTRGAVGGPANFGTLQINSRPWARILVDERFVGNTPQRALRLPPGRHFVKLSNDAFGMSKAMVVTIESGATIKRVETLEEDPASVARH